MRKRISAPQPGAARATLTDWRGAAKQGKVRGRQEAARRRWAELIFGPFVYDLGRVAFPTGTALDALDDLDAVLERYRATVHRARGEQPPRPPDPRGGRPEIVSDDELLEAADSTPRDPAMKKSAWHRLVGELVGLAPTRVRDRLNAMGYASLAD